MTWNHLDSTLKEALDLPLGRIAVDMGIAVEGFIRPNDTLAAASALKEYYSAKSAFTASTQAELIIMAQKLGPAFTDSPKFILIEGAND